MRVAIYQFDTVWLDQKANLDNISTAAHQLKNKADMLFLHEMFNTGYTMHPNEVPVFWQDECVTRLSKLASECDLTILGTIPFLEDGKWTNRMIIVGSDGLLSYYDKVHLFSLAGETNVYKAGSDSMTFQIGKWNIRPLICYDLRFPYLSFRSPEAHMLFYSANWPSTRVSHWEALLKARAIENQSYVIGVNRTGTDKNGYVYPGRSCVISYTGEVLCQMNGETGWATADLSYTDLIEFRLKLPFIADRKPIW